MFARLFYLVLLALWIMLCLVASLAIARIAYDDWQEHRHHLNVNKHA